MSTSIRPYDPHRIHDPAAEDGDSATGIPTPPPSPSLADAVTGQLSSSSVPGGLSEDVEASVGYSGGSSGLLKEDGPCSGNAAGWRSCWLWLARSGAGTKHTR